MTHEQENLGVCVFCGETAVTHTTMTQQFPYADGDHDVFLTADVPVEHCTSCGEMLVGSDGEMARHEAVCNYLNRLTPTEVKAIRSRTNLSQQKFAERLGIGVASIKRWELGTVIQSKAHDKTLRELGGGTTSKTDRFVPVFRTEITGAMLQNSKQFRLRAGL